MSNLDSQLKTFLRVARLGSFRRAADELHVTQAAVTSRIKALEEWLDFKVFRRHRRGAELTEQGERFIGYARNAIDTIEHGRTEARRAMGYRAHYRFMSQYLLLDGFSLDWLDWMQQHTPDVSLSIDSGYAGTAARDIANGLLDLAVGYQYQVTNGVIFEPLFDERLILVTSQDDMERWRDNYISIGWDDAFDDEHRRFVGELERNCRVHAEFIDIARTMLVREACSAYVVERSILPLIEQNLVQLVPDAPVMIRPAHAIYPAQPTHPDVQEVALQGLRDIAARTIGTARNSL
jgi:DNA-binding transcriptional LysR family regulator